MAPTSDASDRKTFEHLRAERARARSPSVHPEVSPNSSGSRRAPSRTRSPSVERLSPTPAPGPPETQIQDLSQSQPTPAAAAVVSGPTLKLTLRSAVTSKDITLTVRPTTTCGTIVAAFVKKAGLDAKRAGKARIVVDGEKLDPEAEIAEADLEDGDMVEVAGL
jgi:hypothetical protein